MEITRRELIDGALATGLGLVATSLVERAAAADAVTQPAPAPPALGDDELGWLEPLGSRAGLLGTTCGVP